MIDLLSILWRNRSDPDAEHWAALRREPRHSDEALTGTARAWLRMLPAGRRPLRLCNRFPRIANRIAWCWRDRRAAEQLLDDLLVDRRGGRHGFPRAVIAELRRLRDFNGRDEPPAALPWGTLRRVGLHRA